MDCLLAIISILNFILLGLTGVPLPDNDIVTDEELKQKNPQQEDSNPVHLQAQIDRAIGQHLTSAGMINAVIGGITTQG